MEIELDFSTYLKEYEKYEDIYLKLIETTFNYLGLNFIPNISVSLINNEEIHQINKEYRQVDSPTDVISFAYLDSVEDKEEYMNSEEYYKELAREKLGLAGADDIIFKKSE